MRLDRLLSIIMLLINRDRMQAKELAQMFDVSVRTIYRDIEAINQAGIPIVTYQGLNGGLGILGNYRVDRNVLSQEDIVSILRGLNGLKTTLDDVRVLNAIEKIKGMIPKYETGGFNEKSSHVIIDLAPWGGNEVQKEKVGVLRDAVEKCCLVGFEYSNLQGITLQREVEPMCLVWKTEAWYLYGYCRIREDYRLFRLSRMKNLMQSNVTFMRRTKSVEGFPWERDWYANSTAVRVVLRFDPKLKALVEERFETESIVIDNDGDIVVSFDCPESDWLIGAILSYADSVEVLKPDRLRERIREKLKRTQRIYESD